MPNNVRNEIKSYIAKSGMTLKDIVDEYNKTHTPTSAQNISNKLSRGTLKYQEALDIAEIIGFRIVWEEK